MAGKKDKELIVVATNLTMSESRSVKKQLMESKRRIAPNAKGEIRNVESSAVGSILRLLDRHC